MIQKEIEEYNRMGKTRDLFKKIGDIKRPFDARMVAIKERNGKDLREVEELKKSCKNTQWNCTKKVLMTWITAMVGSVTWSQTSWRVKSSGPAGVMDFQLSYLKF